MELAWFVTAINVSSSYKNFSQNFSIKMGCTSVNNFSGRGHITAITQVYSKSTQTWVNGWNTFQLDKAFIWDGISNIVIDYCYYNAGSTWTDISLRANQMNYDVSISQTVNNNSKSYCNQNLSGYTDEHRIQTRFSLCEPFNPPIDWNWTSSPIDNSYVPGANSRNPVVSPTQTTTYTLSAKKQGSPAACATQDNVTINVQSAPEKPIPTYNVGLCQGDALLLNFGTTALPAGASYAWTGPGGYTSTAKNPTRAGATPAMNGTYSVVVSSSAGCPSLAGTVNVVVNPAPPTPVLGSNSPLCDGQELKLTSSLAGYKYAWTGPNGFTSTVQNPTRNDAAPQMNGVYSLVIENITTGCKSLNPTTINVVQRTLPAPPPLTANKLTLCPGEDLVLSSNVPGGFLDPNYTFTFFHVQSAWTNVQTAKGAVTATRAAVTAAHAGTYALITQKAGDPCPSDTAFIEINIFDPAAFTATNTGPYCEGDVIQLSVNDAGAGSSYNWTGPGGYTSNIRQATRPAAVVAFSGVYSVSIDNGICANPFTVTTTVNVTKTPNPGTNGSTTVCINSPSIDLKTVLSSAPDAGGTWTDDDASGKLTGSNFNPTVAGTFHFTYTLAAVGACPEKKSVATVIVEPKPNAGTDGVFSACATSQTIDLFSKLNGSPNTGGTWANVSGAPGYSPTGTFNPATATAGTYVFEYTVSGTTGICTPAKAKVTVNVEAKPKAGTPSNTSICNGSTINLNTLLAGADGGGTWTDLNNSGGLSGSVFTSTTVGLYRFKYSTLSGTVCPPSEATVSVTVERKPNPGISRSTSICEDGGLLNLFNELGGNPEPGGTWTNVNASSGFIAPNSFDPAGLGGSTFKFDYEVPGTGVCPAQKATVTVSVLNEPNSGTAIPKTICYGTIFDLYDALNGYDAGGTWRQVAISGGFENGNFLNTNRISLGNLPRTYDFVYKLQAQGCEIKETTISITVNKPANAGRDTTRIFCQVFGEVTLVDYLAGTPDLGGNWTELNGTTSLNVDKINTTSMSPGTYTYEYLVNSLAPCDNQSAQLEIEILEQPDAGTGGEASICSGDVANLFALLPQPYTSGGSWSEITDSGGDLNSGSGSFEAESVAQGVYTFVYTIAAQNGCNESKSTLQLTVTEAPQIINLKTLCSPDRNTFTVSFDIVNGDAASYSVDQAGTLSGTSYTSDPIASGSIVVFTVSDASGCGINSIEVDKSCDCTTEGQKTNTTPIKICDATTVTATVTGTFVNDSNDVQKFYLHRGNGFELIDPIDSSSTPTFTFKPATMFYDSLYYISAVVGNNLNGFPDRSDDCFQVSQGTPVQFFEGSQLVMSMDKTVLCPGDIANLTLSFTGGKLPYTINYRENGLPKTFIVYTTDTIISYNPTADVTLNFSSFRNANGCTYSLSKVYTIDVNKAPAATITDGDKQCAGDNPSFFISVTGEGSVFEVKIDINGLVIETISNISKPGVTYTPTNLSASNIQTYTLISVTDNSNSICPGQVSGTYDLYPKPIATIGSGNLTICEAEPFTVPISLTGVGSFDVGIDDGNGQAYTVTLNKGDTFINYPTGLSAGNYSFTVLSVVDNAIGCQSLGSAGTYNVTINPGPAALVEIVDASNTVVPSPHQTCEGDGLVRLRFSHLKGSGNTFEVDYTINGMLNTTTVSQGASVIETFTPTNGANTIQIVAVRDDSPASCSGTGNSVVIQVNPKPVANLSAPIAEFCEGEDVIIQVSGSGVYPLSAELLDNQGNLINTLTVNSPSGSNVNLGPLTAGNHVFSIGNISDASNNTCSSVGNSQIVIDVIPVPTAVFAKSNYTVCDGESVNLELLVTGNGTVNTSVSNTGNSYTGSSTSGSIINNITLPVGVHTFSVDSVYDSSTALCVAKPVTQTTVTVQALPSVNLAWSQSPICENMPVDLLITTTGNGPFNFNYSDSEGNNYQNNIPQGVSSFPFIADKDKTVIGGIISDNTVNEQGNACSANANVQAVLDVLDRPEAIVYGDESMCEGQSALIYFDIIGQGPFDVDFIDNESGQTFNAQFTSGTNTYSLSPLDTGIYSILSIRDSNNPTCDSTGKGVAQISVITLPKVDFITNLNDSCSPFLVRIDPVITSDYGLANCTWDLGNGTIINSCASVESMYTNLGSYDVSLNVTHTEGCSDRADKNKFINIHPDPIADFDMYPSEPTTINSLVQMYNNSQGAVDFNWYLDSALVETSYQPYIQMPLEENAIHTICLEAISAYNCRQTVCESVKVKSVDAVFIPNTFTPDGDNINDIFLPSLIGVVPTSYRFEIFNRWGQKVFETNDLNEGWDGTYKGENAKLDVYTVLIHVSPKSDPANVLVFNGLVNLIR